MEDDLITVPLKLIESAKPLEMVLIPTGTFLMGSPNDERGRWDSEGPQQQVIISKSFYIGKYEVTQAQYFAVIGRNLSHFTGNPNNPVEGISWYDAAKFCNTLSRMNGLTPVYTESGDWRLDISANGYRLPTVEEWEYACRADSMTRFSFGDALDCDDYCGFCELADKYMWWCGNNNPNGTKEVGTKLPNSWGLYDMHGNVWEWCNDKDYYLNRMQRGGGWSSSLQYCRSAFLRGATPYYYGDNDGGFRVCRTHN